MSRSFSILTRSLRHLNLRTGGAVSTVWLLAVSECFAQGAAGGVETEEKGYVPSYLIIMFAVGLALLVICRSGKRTTSFRHDDD